VNAEPNSAPIAAAAAPAAAANLGDAATLRTVARFARQRAEDLIGEARANPALTNKRRLLASGAVSELRHLADTLDGMAVKVEEGGAR
jgi:hypothetical protein